MSVFQAIIMWSWIVIVGLSFGFMYMGGQQRKKNTIIVIIVDAVVTVAGFITLFFV